MTGEEFRNWIKEYIERQISEQELGIANAKESGCIEVEKYCDGRKDMAEAILKLCQVAYID